MVAMKMVGDLRPRGAFKVAARALCLGVAAELVVGRPLPKRESPANAVESGRRLRVFMVTKRRGVYWPAAGHGLRWPAVAISLLCAALLGSGRLGLHWIVALAAGAGVLAGVLTQ